MPVKLLGLARTDPRRGVGASGSGALCPRLMGVETVRTEGRPTVFHSGKRRSTPITSASSPNELRVVQLRRVRWANEVSSRLSANIVSSDMASSSVKLFAGMDTTKLHRGGNASNKKGRVFARPYWNFLDTRGVRSRYFGGSVALGAAGLGAVPRPVAGFGAVGLVAAPVVGGAGTPDCTL